MLKICEVPEKAIGFQIRVEKTLFNAALHMSQTKLAPQQ